MLIAQISDTHILAPDSDEPSADLRADCLRRTVEDVNAQRPDVVIFTGDTVQHGQPEEYARLRELLAPLEAPLYLVPGNRDDNNVLRESFSDKSYLSTAGGFLHYEIDEHDVRLIAIDSTASGERKGRFCAEREARLDAVLSEQPERATLLFIHHPPFDVDDHYVGGYRQPEEAVALENIVVRNPQIVGLLCGHVHWLVEREWAGVQARIMPSIAVDVRKGIDENDAQGRPIYLLHRVSAQTRLVSEPRHVQGP
jgi:3',5'-cyclic AMP phosphodiesterase CpdA